MSIVSLAIVNRENQPLYVREFGDIDSSVERVVFGLEQSLAAPSKCSIRQQFILKEALERLEHVDVPGFFWRAPNTTGNDAKFVGLLFPIEDLRCYGE